MDSMSKNKVWTLLNAPKRIKPIGCKYVFKDENGHERQSSYLQIKVGWKGYQQSQCVDYDETYSLVARVKSIQIFLAIVTHYENELWQMDVKTAFLNGNLIKEVYRTQP